MPDTIEAVLAARMTASPEDKRLVQIAAVIGTEVPVPLLQRLAGLPEDALQRGLAHLQGREFLYETHLFPEHAYTFKHALTREVAYGSLLHERRRALHIKIVDGLEALYPDRLVSMPSASPTMPCGARCGRRRCPTADRPGRRRRTAGPSAKRPTSNRPSMRSATSSTPTPGCSPSSFTTAWEAC